MLSINIYFSSQKDVVTLYLKQTIITAVGVTAVGTVRLYFINKSFLYVKPSCVFFYKKPSSSPTSKSFLNFL